MQSKALLLVLVRGLHWQFPKSLIAIMKVASKITLLSAVLLKPCRSFMSVKSANALIAGSVDIAWREFGTQSTSSRSSTARFMSSSAGGPPPFRNIGLAEMKEIVEDYEEGGREESQYCVIDVRMPDEIAATGPLGKNVYNIPVQTILQTNALAMDEDDFEEAFGFAKPQMDETLVFSCAAGIRSNYACQAAAAAGYTDLINYVGGANEWFHSF